MQKKNGAHIKRWIEHLRLVQIARDAIQHENIFLGMKPPDALAVLDEIPP